MAWRQKIFSNVFWRNVVGSFGGRSGYTNTSGNFTSYFLYKIGEYQPDLYLYFQKEPYPLRYKNEIFNKLNEYNGFDIAKYLDFHFDAYSDKADFLRFLRYEIAERLKMPSGKSLKLKLQSALDWVAEKDHLLHEQRDKNIRQEIEDGVREIVKANPSDSSPSIDAQIGQLTEMLTVRINKIVSDAELNLQQVSEALRTGNLQLNNRHHEDHLIQVLILLMQVRVAKGEQLLKKFTHADVAAFLLHFEGFHDKKMNTLQRRVGDQNERIRPDNPKVKKLSQALQEFFY